MIRFLLGERDWSQKSHTASSVQVIGMCADSSAAEAVGSWLERVQLYKTVGVRESAGFGIKANYFNALEPNGDLGFRQRR